MDKGYLNSNVMNIVDIMGLKDNVPTNDNNKVLKVKKMYLKYCKYA
jgi:hypothetical protein